MSIPARGSLLVKKDTPDSTWTILPEAGYCAADGNAEDDYYKQSFMCKRATYDPIAFGSGLMFFPESEFWDKIHDWLNSPLSWNYKLNQLPADVFYSKERRLELLLDGGIFVYLDLADLIDMQEDWHIITGKKTNEFEHIIAAMHSWAASGYKCLLYLEFTY